MSNVYYYPEDSGLSIVGEYDSSDGYEFTKTVVWKNKKGQMLWAQDSGCSCPTPFEDHNVESLERLNKWSYFEESVRGYHDRYTGRCNGTDSFLATIRSQYRVPKAASVTE